MFDPIAQITALLSNKSTNQIYTGQCFYCSLFLVKRTYRLISKSC